MASSKYLYDKVRIKILQMIDSGELKVDEKIPSEKELGDMFNASRITIRRAVKELVEKGVLRIVHGKGTFVCRNKRRLHILNLKGFTEGIVTGENTIQKIVISKEIMQADESLKELFQREDEFKILKLIRKIKDENSILSIDYAFLPLDLYPDIENEIKDNVSTFEIIHKKYNVNFATARKEIEIIHPSDEIAQLIDVPLTEQVIKIKKLIKNAAGEVVHYSRYYLDTNSVKFAIDIDMEKEYQEIEELPEV